MQRKSFDMPDVIEDARSKRKTLSLVILNFFISVISNTMSEDIYVFIIINFFIDTCVYKSSINSKFNMMRGNF
jgi:hypothetical protein